MTQYTIAGVSNIDFETYTQIEFKAPQMDRTELEQYVNSKYRIKVLRFKTN